jgi:hypothetical protein
VPAPAETDREQAGGTDRDARELAGGRQLVQRRRGDQHREDHLRLQHQRGQPGRHPGRHRGVEQPELAEGHERAHPDHRPPRHRGTAYERGRRQRDRGEPDRGEQQRRHVRHAPGDHHEVEAPDRGDQRGEQRVAQRHAVQCRPGRP